MRGFFSQLLKGNGSGNAHTSTEPYRQGGTVMVPSSTGATEAEAEEAEYRGFMLTTPLGRELASCFPVLLSSSSQALAAVTATPSPFFAEASPIIEELLYKHYHSHLCQSSLTLLRQCGVPEPPPPSLSQSPSALPRQTPWQLITILLIGWQVVTQRAYAGTPQELLAFLSRSLPGWCALLEVDVAATAAATATRNRLRRSAALHECLTVALKLTRSTCLPGLCGGDSGAAALTATGGGAFPVVVAPVDAVAVMQLLLHMLRLLHCPYTVVRPPPAALVRPFPEASAPGRVTGITDEQLLEGWPRRYWTGDRCTLPSSSFSPSDLDDSSSEYVRVHNSVAVELASVALQLSKGTVATEVGRTSYLLESIFTLEQAIDYHFASAPSSAADGETWATSVVSAVSILLGRYGAPDSEGEGATEPEHTRSAGCAALLRQVVSGITCVSGMLTDEPARVAEVLKDTLFFDNLVAALHKAGRLYGEPIRCNPTPVGSSAAAATAADSHMRLLQQLCSAEALQSLRMTTAAPYTPLETPILHRVAPDSTVAELLHSYLGLLTSQRRACALLTRLGAKSTVLDTLNRLGLTPLILVGDQQAGDAEQLVDGALSNCSGDVVCSPPSCVRNWLLKYALDLATVRPIATANTSNRMGVSAERLQFTELVRHGLFNVLLGDKGRLAELRRDREQLYAVVFLLLHVLAPSPAQGKGQRERVEGESAGVKMAVSAILDNLAAAFTPEAGLRVPEEDGKTSALLSAVLVCSARGHLAESVCSTIAVSGISRLVMTATRMSTIAQEMGACSSSKGSETPLIGALEWLLQVLMEVASSTEATQARVMEHASADILTLFFHEQLRPVAARTVATLLCYPGPVEHMQGLITHVLDLMGQCEGLTDDGGMGGAGDCGGSIIPAVVPVEERDEVLLSLLSTIRSALSLLARDDGGGVSGSDGGLAAMRRLQSALCGGAHVERGSSDIFLRLLHRVSLPWISETRRPVEGIAALLNTVTSLVKGYPPLRATLFTTIHPMELVDCFRTEWLAAEPHDQRGFVAAIIGLAYEETVEVGGSSSSSSTDEHHGSTPATWNPTVQNAALLAPLLRCIAQQTWSEDVAVALNYALKRMSDSADNCRASLVAMSNAEGHFDAIVQLLSSLLTAVAATSEGCTQPSPSQLLEKTVWLLTRLASHNISVRQLKQLMISIGHGKDAAQRVREVPVLVRVLSGAARLHIDRRREPESFIAMKLGSGPVGIRATLREFPLDGHTLSLWLRVESHPQTRGAPQCVYSVATAAHKTHFAVMLTDGRLSVHSSHDARSPAAASVPIPRVTVPAQTWVHLVFVQRSTQLFSDSRVLQVFVNGAEAATLRGVACASLPRAHLFVGTRCEEAERQSMRCALAGQIAELYFFERALVEDNVRALFQFSITEGRSPWQKLSSSAVRAVPATTTTTTTTATANPSPVVVVNSKTKEAENLWTLKAVVCVDPRLGEAGNLYNLAAVLKGRPQEAYITVYDGTELCNANNIVDTVCVLGAMYSVVMPLITQLVNTSLPLPGTIADFTFDAALSIVSTQARHSSEPGGYDTLADLMDMLCTLAAVGAVREDICKSGVLTLLGYTLKQLGALLRLDVSQHVMRLCLGLLRGSPLTTASPHLFTVAYSALFLSSDILHACAPETGLMWVNTQRITAATDDEARDAMRSAGAQLFIAQELIRNVKEASAASADAAIMREQLLLLLETLTVEPFILNDAVVLDYLVRSVAAQGEVGSAVYEVLRRVRITVAADGGALLPQLLCRCEYVKTLAHLFTTSRFLSVRREAQLQLILIAMRARRAQDLVITAAAAPTVGPVTAQQPAAIGFGNAGQPEAAAASTGSALASLTGGAPAGRRPGAGDISLVWMGSLALTVELYMTLRCGMLGDFTVREVPTFYVPVTPSSRLLFAPVAALLLSQLGLPATPASLRICVLTDLSVLLKNDAVAWRKLQSNTGWYMLVVDLCANSQDSCKESAGGNAKDCEGVRSEDAAVRAACEKILSLTFSRILCRDDDGASELRLAVAYMRERGVLGLLNGVLCGVAEHYRRLLESNTEAGVRASCGFGDTVTFANFCAYVYMVEEVIFYYAPMNPALLPIHGSHTAHLTGTALPPVAAGGGAFAAVAAGPVSGPAARQHGYTEWEQLALTEPAEKAEEASHGAVDEHTHTQFIVETQYLTGEWKLQLLRDPDGRWFHLSLALRVAALVSSSATLLNYGSLSSAAISVSEVAGGAGEFFLTILQGDARTQKGGFMRVFARLLRVAFTFTLRDQSTIEHLLEMTERFIRCADRGPTGVLATFVRTSSNIEDYKEHSALVTALLGTHSIYDLLLRRIRAGGELLSSPEQSLMNRNLVTVMRHLIGAFRKPLEQLQIFQPRLSEESTGEQYTGRLPTLQWLCADAKYVERACGGREHLLDAFVEVASRSDFNTLVEKCSHCKERVQAADKQLAPHMYAGQERVEADLRVMAEAVIAAHQSVSVSMAELVLARDRALDSEPQSKTAGAPPLPPALSHLLPTQTTATVSTTVLADMWMRLMEHLEGSMWCQDPVGETHQRQLFARLLRREQQFLVRRKLGLSKYGSDHRDVTMKYFPVADALSATEEEEADSLEHANPLRLRGGEEVLLRDGDNDDADNEAYSGADDASSPSDGQAADGSLGGCSQPNSLSIASVSAPPLSQPSSSLSLIHSTASTTAGAGARAGATTPAIRPGLTLSCEVPCLMHCWSATFTLLDGDVVVVFDEVNIAYNQAIAKEAEPFLMRPMDFRFSVLHLMSMAPGRRFRMKRTAVEMWLHNRKSFFINFPDAATMRIAAEALRSTAARLRAGAVSQLYVPRLHVYQENPSKEPLLAHAAALWQRRELSNFDYLLYLNLFAGRTTNDVTQYPVFPWVVADYTSETLDLTRSESFRDLQLPIGVCGAEVRRAAVQNRYEEMKELGDVPSHYFIHYSSSAVTLYYLVRLEPFTTLQILLQGGHFDHADRMFHSVRSCYRSVMTSAQDVRELIPEMYYLPELCFNNNNVQFGLKQDKTSMGDLVLPPWAHSSPHEFIFKMRAALECDYVSSMLHHWIDLIFGYKQRGKHAIDSLNVFNWHSYEDIDRSCNHRDDMDGHLLVDCLDNIGQTPIQLFRGPHEARAPNLLMDPHEADLTVKALTPQLRKFDCSRVASVSVTADDRVIVVSGMGAAASYRVTPHAIHKKSAMDTMPPLNLSSRVFTSPLVKGVVTTAGGAGAGGGGGGGGGARSLLMSSGPELQLPRSSSTRSPASMPAPPVRSSYVGAGESASSFEMAEEHECHLAALPAGIVTNTSGIVDGACAPENTLILRVESEVFVASGGLYDHSVLIRSLTGFTEEVRLRAHCGRVILLAGSEDGHCMVTAAEDTTFAVWSVGHRVPPPALYNTLQLELLFTVHSHDERPSAAAVSTNMDLVVTASADGVLKLHSLGSGALERTLTHPREYPIDRVLIQSGCYVPNILFASDTDHTIHQMSLNGAVLRSCTLHGRITCWGVTPAQHLLVGCSPYGGRSPAMELPDHHTMVSAAPSAPSVVFLHSFYLDVLKVETLGSKVEGPLLSIACHPTNAQVMIAGAADGTVALLKVGSNRSAGAAVAAVTQRN